MAPTDTRTVTLARRMMIYVFIIVFCSLVLGIEFLIDINDGDLYRELEISFQRQRLGEISSGEAMAPIDQIKKKVILLIVIQSLVTGVVLILFVKKITIPLGRMFAVTTDMARGNFKNPIPVYINDEIGKLGWFINDVVSDFGEVIGHVRAASRSCRKSIESMRLALEGGDREAVLADMKKISEEMERLDDMTMNFNLARVDLSRLKS
jgi:signal transduction histidine kinase